MRKSQVRRILTVALALSALAVSVAWKGVEVKTKVLVMDVKGRGEIVIELFTDKAPKATSQIAKLADSKFYDAQRFFKVVRTPRPFLAQIGDPQSKTKSLADSNMGNGGTGAKIPYEDSGVRHTKGVVGLAMKLDEGGGDETYYGDSQFYIMLGSAGFLDGKYTVFGRVVSDFAVVDALKEGDVVTSVHVENR
ncbi:MAG: peptidylprolyl isomerase [Armatimonadetes bacterium]|nr:peptidylprolyl isomerase [Armatimonadota bacterium]